jgi:ATP-dependent protease ClpP protease subunit
MLAFAGSARADKLVLQDGRTLQGDILSEDESSLVIELHLSGSSLTQRIDKSQIKTWLKLAREGEPYVVIPFFGEIGTDITAAALDAGLREARAVNPSYVILAIDSPGGRIGDMVVMIELINSASKDLHIVAYVKSAYSAAAVVALSCPQIYFKEGATIGATVPFKMTETGPAEVDAKFRSIIEAQMRAASQRAGHPDLLVRGMSETDLELYVVAGADRKPTLATAGPGKLIKSKGTILCLTADEAVECGVGPIAPSVGELGSQVCGGPWHEMNRRPWNAVAAQQQREKAELAQRRLQAMQQQVMKLIQPRLEEVERRASAVASRVSAAQSAMNDLLARYQRDMTQINNDYQQAAQVADQRHDSHAAAHAKEIADTRAAQTRQAYQNQAAPIQAEIDAAKVELSLLQERQKQLLAIVPKD